jgi:DnaJ-class molecular chaperone
MAVSDLIWPMFTYYETLEVPQTAKAKQIKASYRALVKRFHPDLFPAGSEAQAQAEEQLRKIIAAYSILSNPQKKSRYDASLTEQRSSSLPQPEYCGKCGKPTLYWHVGKDAPLCNHCGSSPVI